LIVGQTSGVLTVIKIADAMMQKLADYQVTESKINKVVQTSRKDYAVGTSKGLVFVTAAGSKGEL